MSLPEAKRVEVCILIAVGKKRRQEASNNDCTVNVEQNSNITEHDDNNVQNVPEALEVLHFMFLDFQNFFDSVVDDEENENSFAGHDKMIESVHITDQLQGSEVEGWDTATGCWIFEEKSGRNYILL